MNTPKIFGIGLSKTGTTSLFSALEQLGYRAATYRHMHKLGLADWFNGDFSHDYLDGFDAVTDLPISTWFRELDARYPGSKFILTDRPVDEWLTSIGRQFSANPSPEPFNRATRLAQYGSVAFHESRYRRVHAEHRHAVERHFQNRPDDLLVLNLFAGDGWPELCNFLGKPIPEHAFPNIKPGASTRLQDLTNPYTSPKPDRFAFVMPLVHPEHPKVDDYAMVETLLRESIRSILAQSHEDVLVVVVCDRAPDWADSLDERVTFLTLNNHASLAPDAKPLSTDKGVKYVIGSLFALQHGHADWVMPMDADDMVRRDLCETVIGLKAQSGRDGFIIRDGLHGEIEPGNDQTRFVAAYDVEKFDDTCGSCRIFNAPALASLLAHIDPNLFGRADRLTNEGDGRVRPVNPAFLDTLEQVEDPGPEDFGMPVFLLGRHVKQAPWLSFAPLKRPLAMKICGHGQHHGMRMGAVHWHKVIGITPPQTAMADFGMAGSAFMPVSLNRSTILAAVWRTLQKPKIRRTLKTALSAARNMLTVKTS